MPTPRFSRYRYPAAEGGSFSGSSGFSDIIRVSVVSENTGASFRLVTTTVTSLVIAWGPTGSLVAVKAGLSTTVALTLTRYSLLVSASPGFS